MTLDEFAVAFREAADKERKESAPDGSLVHVVRSSDVPEMAVPEGTLRVFFECQRLNLLYRLYHVPSDYYSWELSQRA